MESKAIAKMIRIAPRKARLVVDLIRGKKVGEAIAILTLTPKAASKPTLKVLKSAIANAEHNYNMDVNNLYVKTCYVTDGIRMKRMLPRAKGRGDVIQKRTCNVTVVVAEKESK